MKKLFFVSILFVGIIALGASCKKTCECTTYLAGNVVTVQDDVELGDKKKCSDFNTVVLVTGVKTGVECK